MGGRDAIRGRVDDRSSWRYADNAEQMSDGRWQMAHGRWHMAGGRLGGNGPDPEQEATWELATAGPAGWRLSLSAAQRRCVGGGPGGRLRGPQDAGLTDRAERGRAGRRSRQPADPASRAAGSREHRSLGRGARGGAAGGGRPAELGRLRGGAPGAPGGGRGAGMRPDGPADVVEQDATASRFPIGAWSGARYAPFVPVDGLGQWLGP